MNWQLHLSLHSATFTVLYGEEAGAGGTSGLFSVKSPALLVATTVNVNHALNSFFQFNL